VPGAARCWLLGELASDRFPDAGGAVVMVADELAGAGVHAV
jgi:hypothetical protein